MPMTEKKLYQAFDLHRFAPSGRLQSVIDASHARMETRELVDDELEFVAGGVKQNTQNEQEPRQ